MRFRDGGTKRRVMPATMGNDGGNNTIRAMIVDEDFLIDGEKTLEKHEPSLSYFVRRKTSKNT